jgi:integrase
MPRRAQPFSLRQRKDTGYYFFKLAGWRAYKPTGTKKKADAMDVVKAELAKAAEARGAAGTLRAYAQPFYTWDACPHVRRLLEDGRSITRRHVAGQRALLEAKILKDPIADLPIAEIRRADVLDFRTRLLASYGTRTVNRTIGVLKVIFKEGMFREELVRDPTIGVGNVKEHPAQVGTFTAEELRALFPEEIPGPWKGRLDYTCFLLAATTGMRRGEIYALRWRHVDLAAATIHIEEAWKGKEETGLPKWGRTRTAPIPAQTINALAELREEGVRIARNDLVICDDDGKRQDGAWWKRHFAYAMKKLKIDTKGRGLRPHSFRHTLNSQLRAGGVDPARIRAMLGWSREQTQESYTHWQTEDLRSLAEKVEKILQG